MTEVVVHQPEPTSTEPDMPQALARGARCRCPNCGEGSLFRKYLKVVDRCDACGADMHHHRADDLPAYIVMSIVGHIVVGGLFWAEFRYGWPMWLHLSIWMPMTLILTFALLQPVKGAIVALQWKLGMHGFGDRHQPTPMVTT